MKKSIAFILALSLAFTPVFANGTTSLSKKFDKLEEIIQSVRSNYYRSVSDEEIMEAVYSGVIKALDPHSTYFDKKALDSFNSSVKGSFVGVGISIEPQGEYIEIVAPIAGSPAEGVGIKAGDLIIAVDGVDIKGMDIQAVSDKIKGEKGTAVRLTIKREGEVKPIEFTIIRNIIIMQSVLHKEVAGYDVVRITSFDGNTARQMRQILDSQKIEKGIIIDLRNNPGGFLDQVVRVSDMFLKAGQGIVSIDYTHMLDQNFKSKSVGIDKKMVVLINGGSASASEIFAGAMQDNKRATIIGTNSYGKGTVQTLFPLSDGTALKLTIAQYATPNGTFIHGIGIKPDIVVEKRAGIDNAIKNFYPMQSLNTSKLGSEDIDTYGLEQRLAYLGYTLKVDGKFDAETESVLKAYQKKHKLEEDGLLDIDMKIAIEADVQVLARERSGDVQLQHAIQYLDAH